MTQFQVPELAFDANADLLKTPTDIYVGEVAGVGANSKGQIFVYTRTGHPYATLGDNRTFSRGGSRLFQFDPPGKFVRELGQDVYGFNAAIGLRVDPQDNVWTIDAAANQVVKFDPEGRIALVLGRKPETIAVRPAQPAAGRGGGATPPSAGAAAPAAGAAQPPPPTPAAPAGQAAGQAGGRGGRGGAPEPARRDRASIVPPTSPGIARATSTWPTASARTTAWRSSTRRAASWLTGDRLDRARVSSAASRRSRSTRRTTSTSPMRATSASRCSSADGTFKPEFGNVGTPLAMCMTRGATQFLYISHAGDDDGMEDGGIYKVQLDGTIVGKFGSAGKLPKQFGLANSIDCRNENELLVGEMTNWRVQKVTIKR